MMNALQLLAIAAALVLTSATSLYAAPSDTAPAAGQPTPAAVNPDALHGRIRTELKVFTDWLAENKAKGFIGEVGWPDDVKGDKEQWNRLADAWYRDADAAGLWVTVWATGEWWGDRYLLTPYEKRKGDKGVQSVNTQASVLEAHPARNGYERGVNVAGAEFGHGAGFSNANPGLHGRAYFYDPPSTYQFLAGRGLSLVRIPFSWERLQRTLNGELDAEELGRLKGAVAAARAAGLKVVLDMHNYAGYTIADGEKTKRLSIGSPELPTSAFVDVWKRISAAFKDEPNVFYGLMNEPIRLADDGDVKAPQVWERISQAALDGIRANGDKKLITVPGYAYSGAQRWRAMHPKGWITDPADNFLYEAHHYWDRDCSGDYPDTYADEVKDAEKRGFKP